MKTHKESTEPAIIITDDFNSHVGKDCLKDLIFEYLFHETTYKNGKILLNLIKTGNLKTGDVI